MFLNNGFNVLNDIEGIMFLADEDSAYEISCTTSGFWEK